MTAQPTLRIADPAHAAEIAALRNAAALALTDRYGKGAWSGASSERGVLFDMRRGSVYVAIRASRIVGSLILSSRKPWAIDPKYFTPFKKPLYLTSMVVDPSVQGTGIGRHCLDEATKIANGWPAEVIRLDAWDADAGAGEFYRRCGYREVGRAVYRELPLVYFEQMVNGRI